jgi:FeoA domain
MSTAYALNPTLEIVRDDAEARAGAAVSLDRLRAGAPARVLTVKGTGAPLGDPLEVRVRNYHLALRRSEAQTISVVMSDE